MSHPALNPCFHARRWDKIDPMDLECSQTDPPPRAALLVAALVPVLVYALVAAVVAALAWDDVDLPRSALSLLLIPGSLVLPAMLLLVRPSWPSRLFALLVLGEFLLAWLACHVTGETVAFPMMLLLWANVLPFLWMLAAHEPFRRPGAGMTLWVALLIVSWQTHLIWGAYCVRSEAERIVEHLTGAVEETGQAPRDLSEYRFVRPWTAELIQYSVTRPRVRVPGRYEGGPPPPPGPGPGGFWLRYALRRSDTYWYWYGQDGAWRRFPY